MLVAEYTRNMWCKKERVFGLCFKMALHIPMHSLIASFTKLDTMEMVTIHPEGYKHLHFWHNEYSVRLCPGNKGMRESTGIIWPTLPTNCVESPYLVGIYVDFNKHLLTIHKGPLGNLKFYGRPSPLSSPSPLFSKECWFLTLSKKSFAFVSIVLSFELPLYANKNAKLKWKSCQPLSAL